MAGIYLHIPFCKSRCIYCDFYSTTLVDEQRNYMEALCKELTERKPYAKGERIQTVYLGGGTPSQLAPEDFQQLFEVLEKIYGLESCREITLEANPDDLSEDYIKEISKLPFNRISIGCQTFNDKTLKWLKRRHTSQEAIEAIERCKKAGLTNISLDLMYGLPGQSLEDWERDLELAISLKVPHISAYHLIYEEDTALWTLRKRKILEEVSEEESLLFFNRMKEKLREAGYEHYELSNFAFPGMYSRHNSSYWKGDIYLGVGASAHSFDGESRQWNVSSMKEYIAGIESNTPVFEKENLDLYTRYNEFVITSLRTCWGLSLDRLASLFGKDLVDYCLSNASPYIQQGKIRHENNTLLIDEAGMFVSDGIMSDLLWVEEE